ncbi:MAG TPA: hypothetical protein VHM92_03380 [Allosphingosinicella sp.]|nr:hypothetical protein [Allosphingosinicella sp.]
MTLAALIAAYHEADDPGGGLRATLGIAGRTLLERQAMIASGAGAQLIVIVVERVMSSLGAALDRLRAEGLEVVLARNAEEAAEAVHPTDRLLLMGDGVVTPEAAVRRLLTAGGHAILTVADVRVDNRYERIDAQSRWAGLALIDGQMLKDTAAMLNDWDLQSTLLRRAVQAGARQIAVRGANEDDLPVAAEAADDLAELEAQILAGAHVRRKDWVSRYLLSPVERAATAALMPSAVTPTAIGLGAALLMVLGALAFTRHWLGFGLALVLLATPLEGIGERLASLRLQGERGPSWWSFLLPALAAGVLVALAYALAGTRGWGCLALAGTIIAFAVAGRIEAAGREPPGLAWLAEPKGMAWLLLPFAVVNLWGTGLTVLAIYAGASFFWVQRHVHASASAPSED